jgi:SPP1 family predicted phage head-tail adaptor
MRAGRLRHRVTIQQRTLAQDAGGAMAPSWITVGSVAAEVRSPAGLERVQAGMDQTVATVTHQVRVRARELPITPAMRVQWKGRNFQIVAITDPDNLGIQQVLDCYEVVQPVRV